ncbi:hypothetical protein [Xanthocytophaga agilis]|uniref:Uncharacterized protein n=1 Tax=Xanthocytophaga agilis TaxID=3048010 RepID=A0AAE3QZ70_9BACT|nr:hypothetical protein [Xanthocytophaga agilis]MDJ1500744.1 hypothetical protein [Xanthocytophaga agilis]
MNPFTDTFKTMFATGNAYVNKSQPSNDTTKVRTNKGTYNQRVSSTTVRVTMGNEITDYHLDYREGEKLAEMDFNGWTPLHKYFGRFQEDIFTGIKYNYGITLGKEKVGKYVESIIEYRNGKMVGEQIYFNTEGDVVRKIYIEDIQIKLESKIAG